MAHLPGYPTDINRQPDREDITKGHLLICDLILEYSKRLRKQVLDSDKRCC